MFMMLIACTGREPQDGQGRPPLGGDDSADTGPDVPLDGQGEITGDCGFLAHQQWTSSESWLFRNSIDLGDAGLDVEDLSEGGAKVYTDGNLGGSSLLSEVLAFELLYRCELADLVKTEAEIEYATEGKKTDLLVQIDSRSVGVSVTRAYHWPPEDLFTVEEADALLTDKLADASEADDNVAAADAWERTILHVIAYDSQYADMVEEAYGALGAGVTEDHILVVSVTEGDDEEVY
ncbi:MAG TPA: hypothetical protein QGF58_18845 [Myxococcota bacterium]|nr:hypothetical protein [Myxococcota bacterium]